MNDFTKDELLTIRHGLCRLIANAPWESHTSNHIVLLCKKIDEKIQDLDDE